MVLMIQRWPRDIYRWIGIYIRIICGLGFVALVSLWRGGEYTNLGANYLTSEWMLPTLSSCSLQLVIALAVESTDRSHYRFRFEGHGS